jgi:hypothetical protein
MTPVVKYWCLQDQRPALLFEAMECLGGNGYVEEGVLARHYREAPVNAIWEGSGNVMALDVMRVLGRAPALFDEVIAGIEKDLGEAAPGAGGVLRAALAVASSDEGSARLLTEQLALSAAAAELRRLGAGRNRRCLHRDAAGRPMANNLRHAGRAARCKADRGNAVPALSLQLPSRVAFVLAQPLTLTNGFRCRLARPASNSR